MKRGARVFSEHAEKQPACLREAAPGKAGRLAAGDLTGRFTRFGL
jgi:hypothetical protein